MAENSSGKAYESTQPTRRAADGRVMNVRDVKRIQATVDALECPPWDPVRIRIEAILVKARIEAEQMELEARRARGRAN